MTVPIRAVNPKMKARTMFNRMSIRRWRSSKLRTASTPACSILAAVSKPFTQMAKHTARTMAQTIKQNSGMSIIFNSSFSSF